MYKTASVTASYKDKCVQMRMICITSPQQGDLKLSAPSPGQSAGGGARTCDRGTPANLRAVSQSYGPPMPPYADVATTTCRRKK
ncbi:hypothetical protein PoB_000195900 [Plakobranchus ocellatus]|uniref:Uncharacterized protein n=1 Tax=Plakobranchus ocellatus TaxID=259542 RepID=A0AAV3XZT5_9GAST|nr:hypothetical protein PoB_000195900 [Plakobranchus ocellatus]